MEEQYSNGPEGVGAMPTPNGTKNEKKPKGEFGFLIGLLVGFVVTFLLCVVVVGGVLVYVLLVNGKVINYSSTQKLKLLDKTIHSYYLNEDEISDEDLENGMYSGMMSALGDPYSVYYTKEEFQEMMESTAGTFCGVGLYLSQDAETGIVKVSRPISGTPGEAAGILAEDILIKVDGEDIAGQTLDVVVSKVKGEEGTHVLLTFMRGEEELEFDVVRAKIQVQTVDHEMKDEANKIGYIRIAEFDDVTYSQFMEALEDLKSQGMKSLVLDLRSNPGGNVSTVCQIADELLPEGLIVYTEDKNRNREDMKSDANQAYTGPMVVLVDGNSASAAEILTGAIKDYGLGTIVGTTTFGKGIVQRIIPLGDGTAVKITVEDYYTPKGNNIHKIGIEPDVEVEFDSDLYLKDKTDNQLEKGLEILRK